MRSKLIIFGLAILLSNSSYVFAQTPTTSKAIEVGNKICPVSGEKILPPGEKSEMGEAVKYEYNGKLYNLCCPMCVKDFKKNPEKYSKIAEDEVAKEKMMEQKQGQESQSK